MTDSPNLIEPGTLYGIAEAMTRLGWGRQKLRDARNGGLVVLNCGKYLYVRGQAIIDFIESHDAKTRN
ncbi:MAG: hypothetical protein ABGZ53_37160 [Fuerstiella sp.]